MGVVSKRDWAFRKKLFPCSPYPQCPMPNAPCPMPNAQCPIQPLFAFFCN
ncbi:histidine kinase [Nostoc sp.]